MKTFLGRLLGHRDQEGGAAGPSGSAARGRSSARPTFDPTFGDPTVAKVRRQLEGKDTRGLESLLAVTRDPDLRHFYVDRLSDWPQPPAWSAAWLKKAPKSAAAHLMAGTYLMHFAWQARGAGMAESVAKEAWGKFFERLECADEMLRIASRLDPGDATPWAVMLITARGLQLGPDVKRERFEEARRRAPFHREAHSQMLQNLCEKWGGSHDQMFGFARGVCGEAHAGSAVHVLLAEAHVERWCLLKKPEERRAYFANPGVREELARAAVTRFGPGDPKQPPSIEDLVARNYFAFCAWQGGDVEPAREHLAATGNRVSEYPWRLLGNPAEVFGRALAAMGQPKARAA